MIFGPSINMPACRRLCLLLALLLGLATVAPAVAQDPAHPPAASRPAAEAARAASGAPAEAAPEAPAAPDAQEQPPDAGSGTSTPGSAATPLAPGLPKLPGMVQGGGQKQAAGPDEAQLAAAIALLQDPAARDRLLAQLKALQAGMKQAGVDAPTQAQTVMAKLTHRFDERVQALIDTGEAALASLGTLPYLADWLQFQVSNEFRRALWWSIFKGVGLMMGSGLLIVILLTRLARVVTSRIRLNPAHSRLRRMGRRFWVCLLDVLPAWGFFLAGSIVLRTQSLADITVTIGTLGLLCFALGHVLWIVSYHALAPRDPEWRWFSISEKAARETHRFVRRTGLLALDGYFLLLAADLLGLPVSVHAVLSHLLFIVVCALISLWIFGQRRSLESGIRRLGESRRALLRDVIPWSLVATRSYLVVIVLTWLYYLVWAIGVPGGFTFLFLATLVTALALVALQSTLLAIYRLNEKLDAPSPDREVEEQLIDPGPTRAGTKALLVVASIVARILALMVVLQVWGLDIVGWLNSPFGRSLAERGLRIAIIVTVAAIAWLTLDKAIQRYLTAKDEEGNIKHSNRSRTLANIGRSVLLVVIGLFATASVLSQLGVDTGPLLAGAGVVGLAIGFGSQALVKDIITGMFILLGDTMRVGDVVDLGGGLAGAVETMSMRAVVMRAYDGSVMTVPYGSITSVTNRTKDFSFAVFNVSISYSSDPDVAIQVLEEIDREMRTEWPYRRIILSPIEIAGVDRFAESAIIVLARLKVRPGDQWRISREFNRRLKQRFDARGIEIPFPHQKIYFGNEGDLRPPQAPNNPTDELAALTDRDAPVRPKNGLKTS